jgi:hypothetical protein
MRREQWLVSLAGSLRAAILIAAALALLRAALGEPGPGVITALSVLPVLGRAFLRRRKRLDFSDAAAVVDRHAELKDRVVTAIANCGRDAWTPLVARQVEDAVRRLATAPAPPADRRVLPSLAARGLLLAGLLALCWFWPRPGVHPSEEPAGDLAPAAARQLVPLDAAALTRSYRALGPADREADPSDSGRQPADAAIARRYFEKMASEAVPVP